MSQSRGQSWRDADADIRQWVVAVVDACATSLGPELLGVHLHGSLACGSYRRPRSDIDLLVVSRSTLDDQHRGRLARALIALSEQRPTLGDLELSVVTDAEARLVRHPMPLELHLSEAVIQRLRAGDPAALSTGWDRDLAAHITVARARGVTLRGIGATEAYGVVPWAHLLDAVLDDFTWIMNADHLLESPCYGILNACRVVQLLTLGPGTVCTKEEGALWALAHLPLDQHELIAQALAGYRSPQALSASTRRSGGLRWDPLQLRRWRDAITAEVSRLQLQGHA